MTTSSLSCSDARHLIHLAVGDDTSSDEERELTGHLSGCSDCRSYHAGTVDAMHAIERVRDADSVPDDASLWPGLADKLANRKTRPAPTVRTNEGRRFNVAVAALCACSMALAFVTAIRSLPSGDSALAQDALPMNSTSVGLNGQAQGQPQLIPVQAADGRVYLVNPQVVMQQQRQQPAMNQELRF